MKKLLIALVAVFTFTGCQKGNDDPPPPDVPTPAKLIQGKWKVLRDSLSNINFYFQEGGSWHYPTPGVYYGNASDYYEFKSDGKLSLFENQNSYNTTYSLISDTKLSTPELDVIYDPATIVTLTDKEFIFYWTKESTYNGGGHYYRKLYLYK